MRKIGKDSMKASALLIDEERRGHNFEIFGFDFMIDCNFNLWLIEINTNPCL
jgi:D-alanine-D-alanine ligase-like ATP-grasp enzyme